ncbi:MAG: rod shape-determining protein MreC [Halanaerobiales bacterium]|nr:rod shape-determining protein MreC [Halanaerobiales bacterium]
MWPFNKTTVFISLLVVLLVAGLGIISVSEMDIPYLGWVEKGLYNLFSPVIKYSTVFYNSLRDYWIGVVNIDQVLSENESLRQRIAELESEKLIHSYQAAENERLRDLLAFKKLVPFKTIGARVIGYSTSPWQNKIIINRGKGDGISEKMPVISYNGCLIGRVDYVGAGSAQITLVNNHDFVVGGIVQRVDSRAIGLVKGVVDQYHINIMDSISWNTESREGDIVSGDIIVTSGLSDSYPRGLPIGKVISVQKDNYGISQIAEIELFKGLKTIEEVLVITEF